jgi:hypothetical protein
MLRLKSVHGDNHHFSCQIIRNLIKTRGYYLMLGMSADHPVVVELRKRRDAYIQEVSLSCYLSQMLGNIAQAPLGKCLLGWEDGRIEEFAPDLITPVQHYIRRRFAGDLPFVVETTWNGQVEARFL